MYAQQYNPYAANIEIVKGYFKSGKVLTLAILNVILATFNFVSIIAFFEVYYEYYYLMMQYLGLPRSADASIRSLSYVYASFGSVWFVLMAVGFFLIFSKSRNTSPDVTPRGGFNLLKVLAVFQLIGAIIGAIFCVIFSIVCMAGASSISYILRQYIPNVYSLNASTLETLMVIAALIILAYAFFLMFQAINRLRFLNSAKKSMNSVNLYSSGAGAYGVVNVILAIFSGFSVVGAVISHNTISIISAVLSMLVFIFTAALALGYNKYIQRKKESYQTNSPYGGEQNNYGAPAAQTPYASAPAAPAYSNNPEPYAGTPNPYSAAPEQQNAGKVCSTCGAPVGDDDPFCGNCGSKL